MFDNTVSLDTSSTPVPETVSLDTGESARPDMTDQRAQKLAFKTGFGQPDYKRTYDEVYASLRSGGEDTLRTEMATQQDGMKSQLATQAVTKLMNQAVQPVNPLQVQMTVDAIKGKPTDPSTVIEKNYGYQYMSALDNTSDTNPYTIYSQFSQQSPEGASRLKEAGGTLVSQRDIAEEIRDSALQKYKAQSWGGYLVDMGKFLNPLYGDMKTRGLVNDRWFNNFGTNLSGTEWENQVSELNSIMDLSEYRKRASAIIERVGEDNPGLALRLAEGLVGNSTSTVHADNILNALDLFAAGQLTETAGKAAVTFGRGLRTTAQIKKAAQEVVRSAESTELPPVAMAQGAGDITEAATKKAAATVVDLAAGKTDQLQVGLDALTSNLRLERIAITTDRGPPPVQNGFTRYFFGGENSSATKIVHQDFDSATNFIEGKPAQYIDIPKDNPIVAPPKGQKYNGEFTVEQVTKTLAANEKTLVTLDKRIAEQTDDVKKASFQKQRDTIAATTEKQRTFVNENRSIKSVELPPEMHIGLQPYEIRPAHSRNYRELSSRLVNMVDRLDSGFRKVMSEINTVERIPALLKVESAMKAVTADMRRDFPTLSDNILDIPPPKKDPLGNWYNVDYHIGQNGAMHFTDEETAHMFAKLRNITNYTVDGEGNFRYINIRRPLPLNADIVRDGLVLMEDAKSLSPLKNQFSSFFSKLRTPDEILSPYHTENRKTAVYSAALLQELAKGQGKYIEALERGIIKTDPITGEKISRLSPNRLGRDARLARLEQWNRSVEAAKTFTNPETGKPGYWFKTPGELEDFYLQNFKRLPDDVEQMAYFAQKNLNELDHMWRNFRVVSTMKQNGVENFKVFTIDKDGKPVASANFDGIRERRLPTGDETVLDVADHLEDSQVYVLNKGGPTFTNEARAAVESGEKTLIRLWAPSRNPLAGFGKDPATAYVTYALVKSARHEVSDIAWEQVPRQEGGHFVYDANHYIKQAQVVKEQIGNVFRRRYIGDATVMPIKIRAMGEDVAEKLDTFRQVLANDGEDAARAHLKANPIGVEFDEVYGWFKQKKDPNGFLQPARLNLDEKIQVIGRNESIWNRSTELMEKYPKGAGEIEDARKSDLANQYAVEFTGERDAAGLKTITNEGTATNPLYKYGDAEYMDPIPVMNRALNRVINSTFLDDYKMFAVEHWIQEAKGRFKVLNASESELRSSPFYFFHNGKYLPDAPKDVVNRLDAQREAIKGLLGVPSAWSNRVQAMYESLTDRIYRGEGVGKYTPQFLADWALPVTQDPLSFLRTVTYHSKLGIMAIPQLIVQSMSYGTMYGIAGARPAAMGSAAATFRVWDNINPGMRAALDAKLSSIHMPGLEKYWWKPGEFTEFSELLDRSGFSHVQGEHSFVNDQLVTPIIRSQGREILDAGLLPFKYGEKNARHGAYAIAYKEFRAEHPTGPISAADAREILNRADLLSGNMSRASASSLHQGILAATTQFMSYQIRLAEQMGGSRLTRYEKARLGFTNLALYGVPAATGLTGVPVVGDWIRQTAINYGYVPGDNGFTTLAMEGALATIGGYITGRGDLQAGTVFNFGQRYGNWGFEPFREAFREDPSIMKMIGGAPYSLVANNYANLDPFFKSVQNFFNDKYVLNDSDFADVINELSGPSAFRRTLLSLNTGKVYSQRGAYLDEAGPLKAIFMGLTGLKNQRIEDQTHYHQLQEHMDDLQKDAIKGFNKEYQRYLIDLSNKDTDGADQHERKAKYFVEAGDLPIGRQMTVLRTAIEANRSLISKIDWKFYGDPRNVPPAKRELFEKTYQTIQEMNKKQGKDQ